MEKSANYNFNLPNSANDEIADINDISDNFRIIDEIMNETDQTYLPTSENAQSGVAVAEGISKEFEVIADALNDIIEEQKWFLNEVIPKEYKVIYHANYDGANPSFVEDIKKSTSSEVKFTLIENPFDRENYTFKGWAFDEENSLNIVVIPGQTTTVTEAGLTVNFYAVWE